jgi:hypothetical protein
MIDPTMASYAAVAVAAIGHYALWSAVAAASRGRGVAPPRGVAGIGAVVLLSANLAVAALAIACFLVLVRFDPTNLSAGKIQYLAVLSVFVFVAPTTYWMLARYAVRTQDASVAAREAEDGGSTSPPQEMTSMADATRMEYDLTTEDLEAYSEYAALRSLHGKRTLLLTRAGLFVFLLIPAASGALNRGGLSDSGTLAAYGVCALLLAWFAPSWVQRRSAHRRVANDISTSRVAGHWAFAIDARGIEYAAPFGSASLKWGLISEVALTGAGVCLVSRSSRGYIVPSRAFAGIDDMRAFGEACATYAGTTLRTRVRA